MVSCQQNSLPLVPLEAPVLQLNRPVTESEYDERNWKSIWFGFVKCLLFADCDGAFLQADWLRWGQPTPQKSSKLSCLLCYWTNLYTKLFSPSSQPKNQSFKSATSWNLSAPTFCSAAITGACCRAKIAIMYNHQVILCPSTPNHLTKWQDLVPEWFEIPSGIVPTKQLASGSFGSSGSATESACANVWNDIKKSNRWWNPGGSDMKPTHWKITSALSQKKTLAEV